MRTLRTSGQAALYYLRQWRLNPRVYIAFGIYITFAILMINPYFEYSQESGLPINMLEPFILMLTDINLSFLLFAVPIILMSDAPFFRGGQAYYILRTGSRSRWLLGQVLYMVLGMVFCLLFLLAITIALFSSQMFFGNIWSQVYYQMANGMIYMRGAEAFKNLIEFFTPITAALALFSLAMLYSIFLVLVMFLVNLNAKRRIGFLAAFMVHAIGRIVEAVNIWMLTKWYPTQNALLQKHSFGMNYRMTELWQSYVLFAVLIIGLLAWIWLQYRKADMEVGDLDGTAKMLDLG